MISVKLKERTGAKITAVILSYVCTALLVLSFISTAVMVHYKFYFSSAEQTKEEIFTDMAQSEAYYIHSLMSAEVDLTEYYKDKNVFYRLTDKASGAVYDTNYNGEDYIASASEEYNHYFISHLEEYGEDYTAVQEGQITIIEVFVAENMTKSDMFSVMSQIIDIGYSMRYAMVFIVLISAALSITLLSFLYCAAGHKPGGVIECNAFDRIPFDILTLLTAAAAALSISATVSFVYDFQSAVVWFFIIGSFDYFVALGYTMSFATRVKTKTIIKNNVTTSLLKAVGKCFKKLFNFLKYVYSNLSLVYKTVVILAAILVFEIFTMLLFGSLYWTMGFSGVFPLILFINVLFFTAVIYVSVIFQKIKSGGEKIAGGDLTHKIDTKYMFGDFKKFAVSLNNINEGLQSAVNEKMKSERFKTELITNVSHDIKTPLTSIINYVDLIKKEDIDNQTVNQYIDVLDRQSGRLKKLVEDLVEASKASTGNLAVTLSECDVGVLLAQTLGEFEDKLSASKLTPVINLPEKSIKIMADGRHLWRVFDNLMNNICKYAMPGTRVYLDVEQKGKKAVIMFRNISANELNISAQELMERFVRGDSSRNTEGSGLGLSIAKSLVEIQNGSLELSVDGDLFKASVIFDMLE